MSTDIDAALNDADFATQEVLICLKGSLVREWAQAEAAVIQAQADVDAAVKAGSATAELSVAKHAAVEAFQAVEQRMHDASITFTMTGVSTQLWKSTQLKHPPRTDNQLDQFVGYNTQTAPAEFIRVCMLAPTLNDDQWAKLLDRLTDAQFGRLLNAAVELNREADGEIPFSSAAFAAMTDSDETSNAPSNSESARDDSGDGTTTEANPSGISSPAT